MESDPNNGRPERRRFKPVDTPPDWTFRLLVTGFLLLFALLGLTLLDVRRSETFARKFKESHPPARALMSAEDEPEGPE